MGLPVTNSFHRPCKKMALLGVIVVLILMGGGCEKKAAEHIHTFGKGKDVTEDLHHRLKAGMFDPSTDPFVCEIRGLVSKMPRAIVRISWDRGSFRVQADDLGKVVFYMDEEVVFSHVQIAPLKEFRLFSQFREFHHPPIR